MKKMLSVSIVKGVDDCIACQECSQHTSWKCPVCDTYNHVDRQSPAKDRFHKPARVRCTKCSEKFKVKSIKDRDIARRRVREAQAEMAEVTE